MRESGISGAPAPDSTSVLDVAGGGTRGGAMPHSSQ